MREFPFDIQYLCIKLKMLPCCDGVCGEFDHPQHQNLQSGDDGKLLVMRPHWAEHDVDKLTEWDVLRIQGRPMISDPQTWESANHGGEGCVVYDGFEVVVVVSREAFSAMMNLALLLFFNVLIAFSAYGVAYDEFADRMSITLTQFLTAMAFKYTANEKLPPVRCLSHPFMSSPFL